MKMKTHGILKGKTAIVTGAGRGLGKSIALAFSAQGAFVTLISRSETELQKIGDEIRAAGGISLVCPGDISDFNFVNKVVQRTEERFSGVDILVNNAAIIGPPGFMESAFPRDWEKTMEINLNGAYYCCRAAVTAMVKAGGGKIINIVSGLGMMPFPRFCAYSVSKAGLIQLTRSLSQELKPSSINVNAIDPGMMETKMQLEIRKMGKKALGDDLHQNLSDLHRDGLLKNPDSVAPLAVFLASKGSDHINGHTGNTESYKSLGWNG